MFVLNLDYVERNFRRRVLIMADLAGISRDTVREWVFKGRKARKSNAVAFANGLGIPFDRLWRKSTMGPSPEKSQPRKDMPHEKNIRVSDVRVSASGNGHGPVH